MTNNSKFGGSARYGIQYPDVSFRSARYMGAYGVYRYERFGGKDRASALTFLNETFKTMEEARGRAESLNREVC